VAPLCQTPTWFLRGRGEGGRREGRGTERAKRVREDEKGRGEKLEQGRRLAKAGPDHSSFWEYQVHLKIRRASPRAMSLNEGVTINRTGPHRTTPDRTGPYWTTPETGPHYTSAGPYRTGPHRVVGDFLSWGFVCTPSSHANGLNIFNMYRYSVVSIPYSHAVKCKLKHKLLYMYQLPYI